MSDLISRQEAIDKFEPWLKVKGYSEGELNMLKVVLCELRCLPSAQPEPIKLHVDHDLTEGEFKILKQKIADSPIVLIPSAEPEIIRCKDCINWDTTWTNDWSPDYHYCAMIDGVRKGDFYCADAERRTDE